MCAGAIVHARLGRVVFGAPDAVGGAAGGWIQLLDAANLNHRCPVRGGVRGEECAGILKQFFREKRLRRVTGS